ncbi:IS30 family transposase [Weissella tructae]|uniref:IS30 family transposase n=1 Tax=Weissella tructae TaxID=887702 RepID=UPI003D8A4AFA
MGQSSWLTYEERVLIEHYWNSDGLSTVEIGRLMGRSQTTIWRELQRGAVSDVSSVPKSVLLKNKQGFIRYSADIGHGQRVRNAEAHVGARKLTYDWQLKIEEHLNKKGWSPEDFVAKFPECNLSASTIRNYIQQGYINVKSNTYGQRSWTQKQKQSKKDVADTVELKKRLHEEFVSRTQKSQVEESKIVKKLSIELRPERVNNRYYFGHWEADLVISRDGLKTPVFVLVERKTRFMVIVRTAGRSAKEMIQALDYFMLLHQDNVQSITFDNGTEFISWDFLERIQVYYGKNSYFAHPNSPHERGTNEQKNKLIRHYVGYKGYKAMTQLDWDQVAQLINDKPMRYVLNAETPASVYHKASVRRQRQLKSKKSK